MLARQFNDHIPFGQFGPIWKQVLASVGKAVRFDVIELDKMPAQIGEQLNPFCGMSVMLAGYSAHAATLTGNWETFYHAKTSANTRQTIRRKWRRLAGHGQVRFVEVRPLEISHTVSTLVAQKRASYRRMGVADQFSRPGYFDFYHAVATNPRLRSIVHVTRLDVSDTPVATGLGLRFKSRYHLILHSYDDQYAKHSPGIHHIQQLLQYAITQRMRIFDFTIGDEAYKDQWSDLNTPLLRYYRRRTIRGLPALAILLFRHYAVRVYRAIRWGDHVRR
jgi:CelD/BcsL family acetyltransferase involved in cellulose biosynthesis